MTSTILDEGLYAPTLDPRRAALANRAIARANGSLANVRAARTAGYVLAGLLALYGGYLVVGQAAVGEGVGVLAQALLYAGLAYGATRRPLACLSLLLGVYVVDQLAGVVMREGSVMSGLAVKVFVTLVLGRGVAAAYRLHGARRRLRELGYTPEGLRAYARLRGLPLHDLRAAPAAAGA